jgi:UDP-N-acetylmuramoyl-L-alanyl-D-glutamate--2,6-diaminopimelate ligase
LSVAPEASRGIELAWLLEGRVTAPRVAVGALVLDSRQVEPGDAFVAVAGRSSHGLDHLDAAVARGAIAVLWDPMEAACAPTLPPSVTAVAVPDLAAILGELADRFYGQPSGALELAGITGTNGKTTCAWLYAACRGSDGAYLGTLGAGRPPVLAPTTHTTLDVMALHRTLRAFRNAGARHVGMEVSSHALDQQRIAGVRLPLAAFTNLTRDHLDYHGTMEAYGAAKERLLHCAGLRHAVINVADDFGAALAEHVPAGIEVTRVSATHAVATTGRHVFATEVACRSGGISIKGITHAGSFTLSAPLVGAFNAENLLVVLGLLLASGVALPEAVAALTVATPPPGRMETFRIGADGPTLVVDYAHTPDALSKALAALRAHTTGTLWCVFGCGGDRDAGKRPLMAAAAEAGADRIVVTDDNPRTEDPERIVAMITAAFSGRVPVHVERDREAAIRGARAAARRGDVILIAGKGHEDYQIYGSERRDFSDRAIADALLREAA